MTDLTGQRILIVGASSGIGRALGIAASAAGARVALAARRAERLRSVVEETGGRGVAFPCDVRRPEDCRRVVEEAVAALGGLDAVVYGAGVSPLSHVHDAGAELWHTVVETNLIGAALVTQAALPHLFTSRGRLVLLGSSSVGRPFPGLVAYASTKAAVHEFARGLRNEYPFLRVSTVVVGPTVTEFADEWDPQLAVKVHNRWVTEGYLLSGAMAPEVMADQIVTVLASPARIDEMHVMPDVEPPTDLTAPDGTRDQTSGG